MDDRINKTRSHDGRFFSLKKEGNSADNATWMNLENIVPSEISQSQRTNVV